jgi:hypothetical protein
LTDIPTVSYLALLRHRDFARLWVAQMVSLFGGVERLHSGFRVLLAHDASSPPIR